MNKRYVYIDTEEDFGGATFTEEPDPTLDLLVDQNKVMRIELETDGTFLVVRTDYGYNHFWCV